MDLTSAQIGERLRVLRKERGWTLQELSRRAGVSLSAVSKIENAQVAPTFDTLVKVARGLGLGFDALLDQVSTGEANAPARGGGRFRPDHKNKKVKSPRSANGRKTWNSTQFCCRHAAPKALHADSGVTGRSTRTSMPALPNVRTSSRSRPFVSTERRYAVSPIVNSRD